MCGGVQGQLNTRPLDHVVRERCGGVEGLAKHKTPRPCGQGKVGDWLNIRPLDHVVNRLIPLCISHLLTMRLTFTDYAPHIY